MSEFSDLFGADFATHSVSVEPRTGVNAKGDVYGAASTVSGVMVEETRKIVIATDGTEKMSNTTIYVDPESGDYAKFTDKARVTLPSGRKALVIQVARLVVADLIPNATVYCE